MDRVAERLWVGDIEDARRRSSSVFDRVVTVCQDSVESNVGCRYDFFPLSDGDAGGSSRGECSYELFREAVETVKKALLNGETVLVHCHVGQSRSVAVAAAALVAVEGVELDEALERIRSRRPMANPTREIGSLAKRYVQKN